MNYLRTMRKIYQIPTIEVNGVLPTTLLAGSGENNRLVDQLAGTDGDGNEILNSEIGEGVGTGKSTPRSNGSALWDEL